MRIDTDWTYILTHKWGVLVFYMQNTSADEAWWRFIVKAVCFGQIRAPPIVFQVRYVLGGWCYIMAPLNIFPWFPRWILQIHLTWTPIVHEASSKFFVEAFFADELGGPLSFLNPRSRRHSYMEAGYNHIPCRFSSFLQAIYKAY